MSAIVDVRERTELAMSVFRFGEQQGMTFKPQPYRGMLAQTFADEEFLYRDARDMPSEFTMPMKAWRRFFAVYENYTKTVKSSTNLEIGVLNMQKSKLYQDLIKWLKQQPIWNE